MRFLPNFKFDQLSFWIGFAAASIFWWIFSRFKFVFPKLKTFAIQKWENFQKWRTSGAELFIRQNALQRAQKAHLAAGIFPLDDILIKPRLLAPPLPPQSENSAAVESIFDRIFPYYPNLPELYTEFPVQKISLSQALGKGANIVVIGEPGTGKTVALASLASQIAREEPDAGKFANRIPIYVHILDLQFKNPADVDILPPETTLIQYLTGHAPALIARRIPKFVLHQLEKGNCLLILDGLDELPPQLLQDAVKYLHSLTNHFQKLQFITTGSPSYLAGLLDLNTVPLSLAAWDKQECEEFFNQWCTQWQQKVSPQIFSKQKKTSVNGLLLSSWLIHKNAFRTPLNWTSQIWAALAGDVSGSSMEDALKGYLSRVSNHSIPLEALANLALEIFNSKTCALSYQQVHKIFSKFKPQEIINENLSPEISKQIQKRISKNKNISSSDQAITGLLESGLLIEHSEETIRFNNPLFVGFLTSYLIESNEALHPGLNRWSIQTSALHWLITQNKMQMWVESSLSINESPLYQNIILICRAVSDSPKNAPWRSNFMRYLVDLIHLTNLSINEQLKLMAGLILTNDPSVSILFSRLLTSESPRIRFLAALGCGSLRYAESTNILAKLMEDPITEVRIAACLALGCIHNEFSVQIIQEALLTGNEDLQLTAAEILAQDSKFGYEALKTAASAEDNLMVRRAAVAGLSHIHELWAFELLQKLSIEDSQWVVRNAAGQALDVLKNSELRVPAPLPAPSECDWLLSYASHLGTGIAPGDDAIELLLSALQSGTISEQIGALDYLRFSAKPQAVQAIEKLANEKDADIQNEALLALWYQTAATIPMN